MKHPSQRFTFWHGLLLGEAIALMIALATTLVPGRSGSTRGLARIFFEQPSFFQAFGVNLAFVNMLIILIAVVFIFWWLLRSDEREARNHGNRKNCESYRSRRKSP